MNGNISAILAGGFLLASCGGGSSSGENGTINTTTSISVINAFPSLNFEAPVFFAGLPGTTQAVVAEQGGKIHRFNTDAQVTSTVIVLDISNQVLFSGEQGLLGLAFHPDFATNGFFYLHYSASNPRRSVISRFTYNSQTGSASAGSEVNLLQVNQPFSNHNGGSLAFGPDNKLYIAFGDGGGNGDPVDNAQDRGSLLGAILRIDVDAGSPYGIPPDNPFVGEVGVREEIWAYGLRNPYRFSFDRQTGTLWAGDVGQADFEEIDIIQAGANYGWRVFEGTQLFASSQNTPPNAILTAPTFEYDHSLGSAVIGGYVYRGTTLPGLWSTYIYGDFVSGRIWSLQFNGILAISSIEIANVANLTSFGEDNSGELYAISGNGNIFRLSESN